MVRWVWLCALCDKQTADHAGPIARWRWRRENKVYLSWGLPLLFHRIRHRLTGPQRGCSCSRCFHHPRRRVPARDFYDLRVDLARLRDRVRDLEKLR